MKWWKSITTIEVLGYVALSLFIWYRKIDGSGTIETLSDKFVALTVLTAFCTILFLIQAVWLITTKKRSNSK